MEKFQHVKKSVKLSCDYLDWNVIIGILNQL